VSRTSTDVCGGSQLSKTSPNTFPTPQYFNQWAEFIEKIFEEHVNNIIKIIDSKENLKEFKGDKNCSYYVDTAGENQYLRVLFLDLSSPEHPTHEGNKNAGGKERTDLRDSLGITDWSDSVLIAFLKTTIRGFLRFPSQRVIRLSIIFLDLLCLFSHAFFMTSLCVLRTLMCL
jgi:hypothetical protein